MAPGKFTSALESSSYFSPDGGSAYAPLRKKVVEMAQAMGYDRATMIECGVNWSDDLDLFNHVKGAQYAHYAATCSHRVFQSFEEHLKDKFDDMMNLRGIGVILKSYTIELKRPVRFPDSVIVAQRMIEVLPDRYYSIITVWSLNQQAIVANIKNWVVFLNYEKGAPANLLEIGGTHADLYHALVKRKEREEKLAIQWEKDHPSKQRSKL